ncbi:acyltransferase family protein [Avibacterium paragallinarum]|uniref:Acyltransferase n=2 Tax=Avibacterium TaxID=292486 RepID=A0ABU7QML1_AVIPA|nr:acyltransferase [Avibacterium paragallinarum]
MKGHIYAFDSLRGIFAIFVAYSHFLGSLYGWVDYPFKGAFLAVDFFFILSGVVLTLAYKEKFLTGKLDFSDFMLIRLFRLYPLHVITMILTAIAMSFSIINGSFSLDKLPFDDVLDHTILNLLLLNGIGIPPLGWSFNEPSWSISVEYWVGCLLLPIILNVKVEYKILLAFIFYSFLFYVGGLPQNNNVFGFINISILRGVAAFLLGNVIYEISLKKDNKKTLMNDKLIIVKGGG